MVGWALGTLAPSAEALLCKAGHIWLCDGLRPVIWVKANSELAARIQPSGTRTQIQSGAAEQTTNGGQDPAALASGKPQRPKTARAVHSSRLLAQMMGRAEKRIWGRAEERI